MYIITIIVYILIIVFFSIQLISLFAINRPKPIVKVGSKELPKVSLLLAARNEEALIMRSLKAIEALDYPKDKIEVLIGNDSSTDRTEELVNTFIQDKDSYKLFQIDKNLGKARGKANVLAHLAKQASGEFYFITDVDVKLPQGWIKSLLQQFETPEVGIVSGTSTCEPNTSFFSTLQSIDWLHFMGYIQSFANIGVACTSVGNNMAVRSKAYWETGGYENIDFSITEDYKLFQEVTRLGWDWRTILDKDSLGLAWYIPKVLEMWHQRKRWLIGAKELPLNWKFMLILYGLFVPCLFYTFIQCVWFGLTIWFVKFVIQSIYIKVLCKKVGLKSFNLLELLVYEFYVLGNTLMTAIFYMLPIKSVWKGRIYHQKDLT